MDFVWNFISWTAFIWAPIVLGSLAWKFWHEYKRQSYRLNKLKYTMLEINIPRDVFKSPQAMEFVIDVLHHFGGGAMDWRQRFWNGSVLFPSSLEIVSIEGSIYFFIRVHTKLADQVKSTIYSQYPKAEINEVDDYTQYVPNYNHHQDTWEFYGADFKLKNDAFFPIKTYIDYELDKVGSREEEEKIDPITPLLEFFGTIKSGEQIWLQFIIRADGFSSWRDQAKEYIKEIMGRDNVVPDDEPFSTVKLTHGEQEQIKAIERGLGKPAFETIIRGAYIARKENQTKSAIGFFKSNIFKPFNSQYFNSIGKNDDTTYDWVWEDLSGNKIKKKLKRFFNDYVERRGFDEPFWSKSKKKDYMIFTSEELATLFHIPGRVSETRSLERIEATKSEAPTNLPL